MIGKKLALITLLLSSVGFCASAAGDASGTELLSSEEERLSAIMEGANIPHQEIDEEGFYGNVLRGPATLEAFREHYAESDFGSVLGELPDDVLSMRLDAVQTVVFWSHDGQAMDMLVPVFREMHSRGLVESQVMARKFRSYIALRRFNAAAAMLERYDIGAPPIPDIAEAHTGNEDAGPVILRVEQEGRLLVREQLAWPGSYVIATISLTCSPSQRAMQSIMADEQLSALMEQWGILLYGPASTLRFADIHDWNTANPGLPIALMERRSDWPEHRSWATPSFHFYVDGEMKKFVRGASILEGLREGFDLLVSSGEGADAP
jgi:hypothetical protein